MKKLFLITVGTLLLSSCVSTKLVDYDSDGTCAPTVAGLQKLVELQSENPNETYEWNYKQCKWVTKTENDKLTEEALDSVFGSTPN